jgi:hypothetical protein
MAVARIAPPLVNSTNRVAADCLPSCWSRYKQQGLLAPRPLRRFLATTGPSATLSPSFLFPVLPVIGQTCSRDFSLGRGGLLQLLNVSLPSCCR